MDTYFIKDKKRTIAALYLFLQLHPEISDKKNYINGLAGEIQDSAIGYAGFKTKKFLKEYLEKAIFGSENIEKN